MLCYLRMGSDYLEDAVKYPTKKAAVEAYRKTAEELARYGQKIEASLHYATCDEELAEYPDYLLELSPRGGVRVTKC